MNQLHYLESLDSVRRPVGRPPDEAEFLARLQCGSEVLTSLALGRDVVVPQPFAVDSWGFLVVAESVLRARDEAFPTRDADERPHPFKLHLHEADSFAEALARMVERATDATSRVFHSSLAPELSRDRSRSKAVSDGLRGGNIGPFLRFLGDGRSDRVKAAWSEFGEAKRSDTALVVRVPMIGGKVSIAGGVALLVEPDPRALRDLHVLEKLPGFDSLRTGLARLWRAAARQPSRGFGNRSALYASTAWPGLERSAREDLGPDEYRLVKEFIDTLYNLVVAHSIGLGRAVCSTPVLRGAAAPQRNMSTAQDCAVSAYASQVSPPTAATRPAEGTGNRQDESFVVHVQGPERPAMLRSRERGPVTRAAYNDADSTLRSALVELLKFREHDEFAASVSRLEESLATREVAEIERSLESHTKLVAGCLAGGAYTFDLGGTAMRVAGVTALDTTMNVIWGSTFEVGRVVATAGVMSLMEAVRHVTLAGRQGATIKDWAMAFGALVEVRAPD